MRFADTRLPPDGVCSETMESRRAVQLKVGGQQFKVVSSASEGDLERLAGVVDKKLGELGTKGRAAPQGVLLAAIALAHDLEEERARRSALERKTRDLLRRVLVRLDHALETDD